MKPRLLDLFCGAGGCSVGYARAGFEVVGVDIEPHDDYPFEFHCADAMTFPLEGFDAIHASPPCQAHVKGLGAVNRALGRGVKYGDLIPATRAALQATGLPFVIENVEGAPLRNPIRLCGSSFGLAVQRHRLFETNFPVMAPPCAHHLQAEKKYWTSVSAHRGSDRFTSRVVQVYGNGGGSHEWAAAMGIDWMRKEDLTQAIPPAYTEHIGFYLMAELNASERAA